MFKNNVQVDVISQHLHKIKFPTISKSVGINSSERCIIFDTEAFNTEIDLDVQLEEIDDHPINLEFIDSVVKVECNDCPYYGGLLLHPIKTSNEIDYEDILKNAVKLTNIVAEFTTELQHVINRDELDNLLHLFIHGMRTLKFVLNKMCGYGLPLINSHKDSIHRTVFLSTLRDYKTLVLIEAEGLQPIINALSSDADNSLLDTDIVIITSFSSSFSPSKFKATKVLLSIIEYYKEIKARLIESIDLILEESSTKTNLENSNKFTCLNIYSLSHLSDCHKHTEETLPTNFIEAFNALNREPRENVEVQVLNILSLRIPPLYNLLRFSTNCLSIYGYTELYKKSIRFYPFAFPNIDSNGLTCLEEENIELSEELLKTGEFNTILDLFWSSKFNHDLSDGFVYGERYDDDYDYDDYDEEASELYPDYYDVYTESYHNVLITKLSDTFYEDRKYSNDSLLNTTALTNNIYSSSTLDWDWIDLTKYDLYLKITKLHKVIIVVVDITTNTIEKVIDFYIG